MLASMMPTDPAAPLIADATLARVVPACQHQLRQLQGLIDRASAHVTARGGSESVVLDARLAPDAFDWHLQVLVTANFALRTAYPLAGRDVPQHVTALRSLAALHDAVSQASAHLSALPPQAMADAAQRVISDRAGDATVTLPAPDFLLLYAWPNLLFHLSQVHAILRHLGVPIGKADFDGLHQYGKSS